MAGQTQRPRRRAEGPGTDSTAGADISGELQDIVEVEDLEREAGVNRGWHGLRQRWVRPALDHGLWHRGVHPA